MLQTYLNGLELRHVVFHRIAAGFVPEASHGELGAVVRDQEKETIVC